MAGPFVHVMFYKDSHAHESQPAFAPHFFSVAHVGQRPLREGNSGFLTQCEDCVPSRTASAQAASVVSTSLIQYDEPYAMASSLKL